ncbi:MAG: TetR/AcrR family transcriptional regulator [Deltaproteobacteria bacterium]
MNKTKRQIFESSIMLFAEIGYERTTMDDIAARACVAKGTLYYYFKSKDDLFNYVVEEGINILKEVIRERTQMHENPIEKLDEIMKIQTEMINKYNKFFIFLLTQLWGSHERQVRFREYIYEYLRLISSILDEAKEKKLVGNEKSDIMAVAFFGMISSSMIYRLMSKKELDSEELANSFMKHFLTGYKM